MTITRSFLGRGDAEGLSQAQVQVLDRNTSNAKALVAALKCEDVDPGVVTLSDNQGNTWELIQSGNNSTLIYTRMWWCSNPVTNAGNHDFTFTPTNSTAYIRAGVWAIYADGQVVLDDWGDGSGSSSTPSTRNIARIADAVNVLMIGEYSSGTVNTTNGWTTDSPQPCSFHSRVDTGNGSQATQIGIDQALIYSALAASFREITGTLIKRETFTVASDISLNSYPSGAAEWAAIIGAVNPTVVAARDRVEENGGNGDVYSRFTGTNSPTGRQRIAAQMGFNTSDHSGCLVVRSPDNNNFYLLQRGGSTLFNVWSYKAGTWSGSPITTFSKSLADVGRVLLSFEAETVGSQVTLRATIDGELFSYNDTLSDRILSGRPGAGVYSTSGSTNNYIDNVVIEDPTPASAIAPRAMHHRQLMRH